MSIMNVKDPANKWVEINPNDSADLPDGPCRSIYVGGDGNLNITDCHGNTEIFYAVSAGSVYPFQATRVLSTSTTATNLRALY